jgi:MFS family permease
MDRSLIAVLTGTFTLRFSTGLTGTLLIYFFSDLPKYGGGGVSALVVGVFAALFYVAELTLSPPFGLLSDRQGFHRVMQYGPLFGAVAVVITGLVPAVFGAGLIAVGLVIIALSRLLEGASTAASVPSILGYTALATSNDEGLRGRVSARFELATILGIGAGVAAAGPLWQFGGLVGGVNAFFLNAVIYMVSLAIFRYGVAAPDVPAGPHHQPQYGVDRYIKLVTTSHVWLLAPTWIAINAALGLYASQSLFALVSEPKPKFSDQLLAGGFEPWQVTIGLLAAGVVFVAGLLWWGNRFKSMRRTTIIFYGIVGGALMVVSALAVNYSGGWHFVLAGFEIPRLVLLLPPLLGLALGLFVLAGATPAALGLLADMSEAYPDDRGAIMGLYSVFLALGQIIGSLLGGVAADQLSITGILLATLALLGVALLPLFNLRSYEHHFTSGPATAA